MGPMSATFPTAPDKHALEHGDVLAPRFDAAGLVIEHWDSWNQGEGLREPPPGWGQAANRG